jgi:hypothetical protein
MASLGFKKAARELVRNLLDLEKKSIGVAAPGYFRNRHGSYWPEAAYEQIVQLYRACIVEAPDRLESLATRYALAAFLRDGLRLEEAAEICELLMADRPDRASADRNLLAFIEARRGNLERARALAAAINADPNARAFRVHEEDLMHEYTEGQEPNWKGTF